MAGRSDAQVVQAVLAGDRDAYGELVTRYQAAVFGVAFSRLGHFEEARDAAQEAFLRAYLQLPALRSPARFGPWLCRIAEGTSLDALRRRRPADSLEAVREVPAEDRPLWEHAVRQELAGQLAEALAQLRRPTRLALILHYVSGYSLAESARFLRLSEGALKTRLSRARKVLRKELQEMLRDSLHEGAPGPEFAKLTLEQLWAKAWRLFQGEGEERRDLARAHQAYVGLEEREGPPAAAAEARMMAGLCLLNSHDAKAAVVHLEEALHRYPAQADAPLLAYLGEAHQEAGEYEQARACYGALLTCFPDEPYGWPTETAYLQSARCLEAQQHLALAAHAYETYLRRYPEGKRRARAEEALARLRRQES